MFNFMKSEQQQYIKRLLRDLNVRKTFKLPFINVQRINLSVDFTLNYPNLNQDLP